RSWQAELTAGAQSCLAARLFSPPPLRPGGRARLGLRPDDALGQNKVAIEPPLAGGHHDIAAADAIVELLPLDHAERQRTAGGAVDEGAEFAADRRLGFRIAHHLHANRRAVDEIVERQETQDRLGGPRRRNTVEP